jgi:hypothetical protein
MPNHDEPPQKQPGLSREVARRVEAMQKSPYYAYVKTLEEHVVGRTVQKTEAGTSGFILYLDNGTWAAEYLDKNEMRWKVGKDQPADVDKSLLNSPLYGNASAPLKEDIPYADQPCDFAAEVAHATGKKITALAFGDAAFNFCFPDGRELDVNLRRDTSGKLAYRVFWEQF